MHAIKWPNDQSSRLTVAVPNSPDVIYKLNATWLARTGIHDSNDASSQTQNAHKQILARERVHVRGEHGRITNHYYHYQGYKHHPRQYFWGSGRLFFIFVAGGMQQNKMSKRYQVAQKSDKHRLVYYHVQKQLTSRTSLRLLLRNHITRNKNSGLHRAQTATSTSILHAFYARRQMKWTTHRT